MTVLKNFVTNLSQQSIRLFMPKMLGFKGLYFGNQELEKSIYFLFDKINFFRAFFELELSKQYRVNWVKFLI